MGKTVAVINQKGGVGKTTTVVNLGASLSAKGYKILLVDTDPQCNLSYSAGGEYDSGKTVRELMLRQAPAVECIQHLPKFDLIGGNSEMAEIADQLTSTGKEYRLKETLAPLKGSYDFILIDSPPALSLITVNVLTAADSVIITAHADVFSMQGIGQLYNTFDVVREYCNNALKIDGILLSRHSDRSNFTRKATEEILKIAEEIGTMVFETKIHESVKVREASAEQKDLFDYAPKCRPAADYQAFTEEYLKNISRQK